MSYEIRRQDGLATRTAGFADTLAEAQRALIAAGAREVDSLVCRDRRTVCMVAAASSVLIVDLRFGRVMTTYTFVATEDAYTPFSFDEDDTAELSIVEPIDPNAGRRWPQ